MTIDRIIKRDLALNPHLPKASAIVASTPTITGGPPAADDSSSSSSALLFIIIGVCAALILAAIIIYYFVIRDNGDKPPLGPGSAVTGIKMEAYGEDDLDKGSAVCERV